MHNINTFSKFTPSWNILCQRNGGQCSSSKCLYLPAGEIEREEFCIDYGRWVSLDKRERESRTCSFFGQKQLVSIYCNDSFVLSYCNNFS